MDGIRAYWNGNRMVSKNGTNIDCPDWFVEKLPKDISLDGELWMERGTIELLTGALNSDDSAAWKGVSLMVFDLPTSSEAYEKRISDLAKLELPNHLQIVNIDRCKGGDHLQRWLLTTINVGGEGLIANKPNSLYISTRIDSLVKVKVW